MKPAVHFHAPSHIRPPAPLVWACGIVLAVSLSTNAAVGLWLSQPVSDRQKHQACHGRGEHDAEAAQERFNMLWEQPRVEEAHPNPTRKHNSGFEGSQREIVNDLPLALISESERSNGTDHSQHERSDTKSDFHAVTMTTGAPESIA